MFFRKYYTIRSNKNVTEVKKALLGGHVKIHALDFEVKESDDVVRIIPHTEEEGDKMFTLPITRLKFENSTQGTTIKMLSKPRRIDIGGPYMIMIFVLFAIAVATLLLVYGGGKYNSSAYIMYGAAVVIFLLLWLRLQQGYFDYIHKIKDWVKSKV